MGVVFDNFDAYLDGFVTTLQLTLISGLLALVLGTLLAGFRVSPVPVLRGIGTAYVEIVRNTPLTLVFFFSVFYLPQLELRFSFFTFALLLFFSIFALAVCVALFTVAFPFFLRNRRKGGRTRKRPQPTGDCQRQHTRRPPAARLTLRRQT